MIPSPAPDARAVFMNARPHVFWQKCMDWTVFQDFKPYEAALRAQGHDVSTTLPADGTVQICLVLVSQNMSAARYQIARALKMLADGGRIVCAANNGAGGKRIVKILEGFGVSDVGSVSKNKARAAWGIKTDATNLGAVDKALQAGAMQAVESTGFTAQPGMFGWNKVDKGSTLLIKNLPDGLSGVGADFGCGYGFLARYVLDGEPDVTMMHCLDADRRAVQASRINLAAHEGRTMVSWADVTKIPETLRGLDFIVMNPPFHEGKKTDNAIGAAFIRTAAACLRPGGALYMVANSHLPYERLIQEYFTTFKECATKDGFKVLCSIK